MSYKGFFRSRHSGGTEQDLEFSNPSANSSRTALGSPAIYTKRSYSLYSPEGRRDVKDITPISPWEIADWRHERELLYVF